MPQGFPGSFRLVPTVAGAASVYRNDRVIFGFSEGRCRLSDIGDLFPAQPVQLKQVHSAVVRRAAELSAGDQGDGLIVQQPGLPVIIKTADCFPLFFWSERDARAGILHIGWRGLAQGIELRLLRILEEESIDRTALRFLIGPGIEKKCYKVGEDLFDAFATKDWRPKVFEKTAGSRFLLDIALGISLSLQGHGIPAAHIACAGLCTYCLPQRFPSYRRDGKSGQRIYNFIWRR